MFRIWQILLVFFIFIEVLNAKKLSSAQLSNLALVKQIAISFPNSKKETYENAAMAICLSETSCLSAKTGDLANFPTAQNASFGIMQVRLDTAKFVAKKFKLKEILKMNDDKLALNLLLDNKLNISIAVLYIVYLSEIANDYFHILSRYNGGNKNTKYIKKVMNNLKFLKTHTNLCTK